MKIIVYLFLVSIFWGDYLHDHLHLIPRVVMWLPEFLAMVVAVYLPIGFKHNRRRPPAKYVLLYGLFLSVLLLGWLLNMVGAAPMVVGLRTYCKYIPWFFLPFVLEYSEKEIKGQLKFILFMTLLQTPLALYQRFIQFRGLLTGDYITGSLINSGLLAIYLFMVIAVLFGLYLRKQLNLFLFLFLSLIVFIPTTMTEVKAAIVFVPLAVMVPSVVAGHGSGWAKRFLLMPLLILMFGVVFVPIYDHFMRPRWGYGIMDFLNMEGRVEGYLYKNASGRRNEQLGRIDCILLAYKELSKDPFTVLLGLGAGNVTTSAIEGLQGEQAKFGRLGVGTSTFTNCFWEIGLLGFGLHLMLMVFVFNDARRQAQGGGFLGGLAAGWCGVVVVMVIALFYKNYLPSTCLINLFWYLSGVVVASSGQPSAVGARRVLMKMKHGTTGVRPKHQREVASSGGMLVGSASSGKGTFRSSRVPLIPTVCVAAAPLAMASAFRLKGRCPCA